MMLNDKGRINLYKTTAKTHATIDKTFAFFNVKLWVESLKCMNALQL